MADNIVEHLRHWARPDKHGNREGRADDFAHAADEIERLRAALHEIRGCENWYAATKIACQALDQETRCEHGLQRDLCGQCSIHLEVK